MRESSSSSIRKHIWLVKGFLTAAVILSEKLISAVVVVVVVFFFPSLLMNMTRKRRDGPERSLPNCQC